MKDPAADLDQVLADLAEESSVLRRAGHRDQAEYLDNVRGRISDSTEEYRRWLTEGEASLQSGYSRAWLRSHYPQWESEGNAKRGSGNMRLYRQLVVPKRSHLSVAREHGERAGEKTA